VSARLRQVGGAPVSPRLLPDVPGGVAVKVCGLTNAADATLAARLGAAALGVVLAPSPRQLDVSRAADVLAAAPPGVLRVGVFVEPDPDLVARAVAACALDWVQLSGRESPERAATIMAAARAVAGPPGTLAGGAVADGAAHAGPGLLKAIHVRSAADVRALAGYPADAFLLDAPPRRGLMGGTGRTFDWSAARSLPVGRNRIAVAGGLTAENVAEAVAAVRPAMVDVSSGVEAAPGIKDAGRLTAFMEALRRLELEEGSCS
jgi:phosphoribosylanthranilate isomerase